MSEIRKFFEEHAAFFAVVVPIATIVASFAGSWAAGWMQARGGRDQAAAAREAAAATNEAQRVAALWTVRQVQVAEFVQRVRELVRVSELFYERNNADRSISVQIGEARQALVQKQAEIELIAPKVVVQAADSVVKHFNGFVGLTAMVGETAYFADRLGEALDADESDRAARARELAATLRGWRNAGGDRAEQARWYIEAAQGLVDVLG
ncbi:hypothetical protein ACFTZM_32275, partial [Streptomyces hydrogenans]